jgi:hypothetical protein
MRNGLREKILLLINPWIYDFSAFDLWMKPTGLLYLAAHLRQNGCRIHLIDCLDRHNPELLRLQGIQTPKSRTYGIGKFYREQIPKPSIFKDIPAKYCRYGLPEDIFLKMLAAIPKPDGILITSMMTYWYPGVFRAIELVKQRFPHVPVILGGIYASLCTQHAQTYSGADYVLPEHKPRQILSALADILHVPWEQETQNSELFDVYPAFDLYPRLDYAILLTSVGCPYRCTYCASQILAPHFVQRKPDDVFQELLYDYEGLNIQHFAFYDDALLLHSSDHLEPFMQHVIDTNFNCTFHTPNGLHARYLSGGLADLMFRSGFKTIRLSLETIDPVRQQDTGGKVTADELTQAVKYLKQAGFDGKQIGVYLFIGLPEQSLAETKETIRYVHSLGVQAHLCEYSPIPGTPDWPILERQGYVSSDDDPLIHNNSIFLHYKHHISFEQMQHLKDWVRALNTRIKSTT